MKKKTQSEKIAEQNRKANLKTKQQSEDAAKLANRIRAGELTAAQALLGLLNKKG